MDYISALIEKTQRDDAALQRLGPVQIGDDASAAMLGALSARYSGTFDEFNVRLDAPENERLMRAVRAITTPKVGRLAGEKALSAANERDLLRWLLSVAGRDIGGLRLERDMIGWCTVEKNGADIASAVKSGARVGSAARSQVESRSET